MPQPNLAEIAFCTDFDPGRPIEERSPTDRGESARADTTKALRAAGIPANYKEILQRRWYRDAAVEAYGDYRSAACAVDDDEPASWADRVRVNMLQFGSPDIAKPITAANDNARQPRPNWPGLVSSGEMVRRFTPPDYCIDGIVQNGFIYSLTAATGTGKTAVLLLLSALKAQGASLAGRDVPKGRVVYFAGENPDDVIMRWIAAAHQTGFDLDEIDVHFVPGVFDIENCFTEVESAVDRAGGASLIIVDTSAAYFTGDDENGNVPMGRHARKLRTLTTLPGSPAVLVACHPTKSADQSNLLPRGGGAFIAEMDGNFTCQRTESGTVKLHWQGKFRGPDFEPMQFDLSTVTAPTLKDSRGREIPTVMASVISDTEATRRFVKARRDEDDVLLLLELEPKLTQTGVASQLDWHVDGKPHKRRAQTALTKLRVDGLIDVVRTGGHELTKKGRDAVSDLRGDRHSEAMAAGLVASHGAKKRPWRSRTEAAPTILSTG